MLQVLISHPANSFVIGTAVINTHTKSGYEPFGDPYEYKLSPHPNP